MANDVKLDRLKVLSANLERCGISNSIMIREESSNFIRKAQDIGLKFDKILNASDRRNYYDNDIELYVISKEDFEK